MTLALQTAAGTLGSRAEASDVAQEVAMDVLRQLDDLRDPASFDAWVHRIAVRKTMRAVRRRRLQIQRETPFTGEEAEIADTDTGAGASADRIGLTDAMRRALRELPARQRMALILRYVHDLSEHDVADALGCRPGTAASLLSRARKRMEENDELRELFEGEAVGDDA
jgi:RNA polymerase sigma-70 factor (ECF subfamily)